MNKFLVTGGAGFIGSHLVEGLINEGYKVVVLDDLSVGTKENLSHCNSSVQFNQGSILDQELLNELCEGIDGIFHLAAHTSVQKSIIDPYFSHQVNTVGTLNILEAAKKRSIKVVYASSSAYYGNVEKLPYQEENFPMPLSPYAAQKILGGNYCDIYHNIHGLPCAVLRFFNVYGPRQAFNGGYAGVIRLFMDKVRKKEPLTIYGDGGQTRDFIYVEDVVRACILAMQKDLLFGIYNVGTGVETSINKLATFMLELLDMNCKIERTFQNLLGDALRSCAHIKKIEKELGFKPFNSIKDGLYKTLNS